MTVEVVKKKQKLQRLLGFQNLLIVVWPAVQEGMMWNLGFLPWKCVQPARNVMQYAEKHAKCENFFRNLIVRVDPRYIKSGVASGLNAMCLQYARAHDMRHLVATCTYDLPAIIILLVRRLVVISSRVRSYLIASSAWVVSTTTWEWCLICDPRVPTAAVFWLAVEKWTETFLLVICRFVCVHDVNSEGFFAATLKQSVADEYEKLEFRFAH